MKFTLAFILTSKKPWYTRPMCIVASTLDLIKPAINTFGRAHRGVIFRTRLVCRPLICPPFPFPIDQHFDDGVLAELTAHSHSEVVCTAVVDKLSD